MSSTSSISNLVNACVTLDLWQTLIFETDGSDISRERRKLRIDYAIAELAELGENVDRQVLEGAVNALSAEITAGHDEGRDSHFGQWINLGLSRIDPELPGRIGITGLAAVGSAFDRAYIECPPILPDGSLDVFAELESRGLKIGLVTNTGLTSSSAFREWFQVVGLIGKFNHMAFSNEIAAAKPDRLLFDATLRALGVAPERALHVGDNLHTDVGGAAAIGMSTVWVRGGVDTPVRGGVKPDYAIDSVFDLVPVVDQWLGTLATV